MAAAATAAEAESAPAGTAASAAKLEDASGAYSALVDKLRAVTHLRRAQSVLGYDRMVFMGSDPETARERGEQSSALASVIHEKSVDPEILALIKRSREDLDEARRRSPSDGALFAEEERLLELERKSFEENERVPADLAARAAALKSTAYGAWVKAKADGDFASFEPVLRECFDTAREVADAKRGGASASTGLYTQMLDEYEMGLPAERIDEVFGEIQQALVPLIDRVVESPHEPSTAPLRGAFPVDAQRRLSQRVLDAMGYDSRRGRVDVSAHPFTSSSSPADVRITSRFREDEWYSGLAGSVHEGGHALYEQALGRSALSVDEALSMGTHESQSLFWERHVGLSLPFWRWAVGPLAECLPGVPAETTPELLYEAVNAVSPSLIRVDADELTYPLHVILRYHIERDVVEGRMQVKDIPGRWKRDMKRMLGVDVPDDARGCLQDVHWSTLAVGYFPTYLLGSAAAAQLAHHCRLDLPNFDELVASGEFAPIRAWLADKVHRHGRRYRSLDDLLEAQVGEKLNPKYFVEYLTEKYTTLYRLA
jgi:carboxypeptidase Taq